MKEQPKKEQPKKGKAPIARGAGRTEEELGICYEKAGCKGDQIGTLTTKDKCKAAGGKSWKGAQSGCVPV